MLRRRARGGRSADEPDDIYNGLRTMALTSVDNGLALPRPDHPDVSGVVVDIPRTGGFATIVALTDNTTSMYTSTGGGTIGGGEHAAVAAANHHLLTAVQQNLGTFSRAGDVALPPSGTVRVHVLTPAGRRSTDVPEDSFWGQAPHPLMPVIVATQGLMTTIREVS